ncbi:hypothetical protein EHS25_006326 [Saitozyma podzolica]|uniref:Dihydroxyacetone synthase n=1 Tax=Saitozyma podzolica TaxID=1890683 RepID=A0A427YRK0_9TREE|nr:hypothetical protein EHS25_006326 [Saitozyma podzolica]
MRGFGLFALAELVGVAVGASAGVSSGQIFRAEGRGLAERDNSFYFNYPTGCEAYCVTGSWNACNKLTNSTAAFDCQCSYTNLQSVAQCVTCARDGGSVTVNGTAVSFDTFMNAFLDSCYEDGYVIPASVYSSIVQHATVTPKVASTTTPVSHASTTTATPVSAASGKPTPLSVQFTAPQVGLNSSAGFTSGAVCIANFFSDVQFDSQFSIFQGMVLQPKTSTTCTGTTCTWNTTDPKRCGGGVCGGIKVPSTMICDNTLKGVDTGLGVDVLSPSTSGYEFEGIPYYIPSLYTSSSSLLCSAGYGEDLTPVKICNCNGPTDGVPSWSDCGSNCQTSLAPVSGLQCNYATRCADGPTYNVQDVFSSSCLTPAFADRNSSGVYHITGTDGSVLDCAGQTQSVDHCGNSGFSTGTSMCTCSGAALSANPCGLSLVTNGTNGSNGSNGSNSSSNGTSGGGGSKVVSAAALAASRMTSAIHAGFLILIVLAGTMLL